MSGRESVEQESDPTDLGWLAIRDGKPPRAEREHPPGEQKTVAVIHSDRICLK